MVRTKQVCRLKLTARITAHRPNPGAPRLATAPFAEAAAGTDEDEEGTEGAAAPRPFCLSSATPYLFEAIRKNDHGQCLEEIVSAGASAGAMLHTAQWIDDAEDDSTSAGLASPLMLGVMLGRGTIVSLLAGRGADADWRRPHNGVTPACIAAQNGDDEMLALLAELGANFETPRDNGATPAWAAARWGHAHVVRMLAELGANLETPDLDGETPAWAAAAEGHAHVVRMLAELGANLETPDTNGDTPAFAAAENGHADVVRVMGELGVNLETQDTLGRTPISAAASWGHTEVVGELAKARPDLVNRPVSPSWFASPTSLLALAVMHGHISTIKGLILLGAEVTEDGLKQRAGYPGNARELRATI